MDMHSAAPTQSPFSDQEWAQLHAEDLAAASAIVILIGSIFCIGIVLYLIVAWACMS
jgi:hypothetical protein